MIDIPTCVVDVEVPYLKNEIGNVIEVTKYDGIFNGCLMYITEVYDWGIEASMKVPETGDIYLRLKNGEFNLIGKSTMESDLCK